MKVCKVGDAVYLKPCNCMLDRLHGSKYECFNENFNNDKVITISGVDRTRTVFNSFDFDDTRCTYKTEIIDSNRKVVNAVTGFNYFMAC